jgi:hypothetical protein
MAYTKLDDSGIAYAWYVISLFLILAAGIYLVYIQVINAVITGPNGDDSVGINHDINEGKLSEQGKNAAQFNIDFATNIPFFLLLGVFVFAVARAIVVKRVP